MNRQCYRLVFNRAKGQLVATSELAVASGKSPAEGGRAGRRRRSLRQPAIAATLAALLLASPSAQASIASDPSAPGNQRPTVLETANGVPQVNIQTPSAAGVSRNSYRQFDVSSKGAILNNSRTNTQTQLSGWVQGNPNLAGGEARVILNEVNSRNPSQLRGYLEVAGSRAEVVIANPAGIDVNGAGFINASRATLTTGTPELRNGALTGYRVQDGTVRISGAGLDASGTDYTAVLARAVEVQGGVWANDLNVVAGANRIGTDGQVIERLNPQGDSPDVAIDVAHLGGMYAGKIRLVATETGVGVNNAGNIAATHAGGVGEVVLTAEGQIVNRGSIRGRADVEVASDEGIVNRDDATLIAGGDLRLAAAGHDGTIHNEHGATLVAGIREDGRLGTNGDLELVATQRIEANGWNLAAGGFLAEADTVSLRDSQTQARDISVTARDGDIDASDATLTASDTLTASTNATLINEGGTLIANQRLDLDATRATGDGRVLSLGDLTMRLASDFTLEQNGEVAAGEDLHFATTGNLTNRSTFTAGATLDIEAGHIVNTANGEFSGTTTRLNAERLTNRGLIDGVTTRLDATVLENLGSGRLYGDLLGIQATTLTNDRENGTSPVIAARERLDIGAQRLINREDALIFSAGDMAIGGSLDADDRAGGQATRLDNTSATIEALGDANLAAKEIHNVDAHFQTAEVVIDSRRIRRTSDDTTYDFTRTTTETQVVDSAPAQLLAGGDMTLRADALYNDNSHILAGGTLTFEGGTLTNTAVTGERIVTDRGTATRTWRECSIKVFGKCISHTTKSSTSSYAPSPRVQTITLTPTRYESHAPVPGTGTQVAGLAPSPDTLSGAHVILVELGQAESIATSLFQQRLPSNRLFRVNPDPTASYLVETDPRFTDRRQWLSSDYLLSSLHPDPAMTHKRLGDGFYEQRLIREQVTQLTGQRFLAGYADDEAQYAALMNSAATFAQAHGLRPGVALTAEQMAQLTSDIVWLVEQTVTLADGGTAKVLVPQVYVRLRDGDLKDDGTLLAGDALQLDVTGDVINSGTLAARQGVTVAADRIANLNGRIAGDDVALTAASDLLHR
ncbi:two-partner secretion domain-containing protein, partial [Billgrantia sp. Q4P2]|uniref:two-partner secretion domain-containing protein n=1 Tax=Billgrantia sp. Q4P2 TaxID=3463857 RepID=UPI004055ABE3